MFIPAAYSQPDLPTVARSRYWRLLLHEKGKSNISEVLRGSDFFFSPDGSTNPEAELRATLTAFAAPASTEVGFFKQHPQCAFPERYRYLKEQLRLKMPEVDCPEWLQWRDHFRASSLTIIYAAPYLGQIESMFGHTFLRVDTGGNPLLDVGISFDALVPRAPGLGFIANGLFGGYPGLFSQAPYYVKIKTYGHLENRDLWERQVSLDPASVARVMDHLWELQNARFPYYFTNGNCSYHLLSLLEVGNPEWHLRDQFYSAALPLETWRAVVNLSGGHARIKARPAIIRDLRQSLARMSTSDRADFKRLRSSQSNFNGQESAVTLDAFLDYAQIKNQAAARRLLLARAKLGPRLKQDVEIDEVARNPHEPSQIFAWVAGRSHQAEVGLRYRPLLHDLLDRDEGYVPFSKLNIGEVDGGYRPEDGKLFLNQFILAEVLNLSPVDILSKRPSWQFSAKIIRPTWLDRDALTTQFRAGVGASLAARPGLIFYALANARAESGKVGPSAEVGSVFKFNSLFAAHLKGESFWHWQRRYSEWRERSEFKVQVAARFNSIEFRAGAGTDGPRAELGFNF